MVSWPLCCWASTPGCGGEIYGVHVGALDFTRHRFTVAHVIERPEFIVRAYPKDKLTRTVPMTERLELVLHEMVQDGACLTPCPETRCKFGGILLLGSGTRPTRYDECKEPWSRMLRSAELEGVGLTWHGLRHTFGTRLARVGTPSKEIANLMGHSSTQTAETYIQAAGPKVSEMWLRHALEGGRSPVQDIHQMRNALPA
jgi:integrase